MSLQTVQVIHLSLTHTVLCCLSHCMRCPLSVCNMRVLCYAVKHVSFLDCLLQFVSIKTSLLLLACWRAHVHIISNCNQIHAVCSNNNSNNITIFRAARDIGTIASCTSYSVTAVYSGWHCYIKMLCLTVPMICTTSHCSALTYQQHILPLASL
jgi:hypothetical protein